LGVRPAAASMIRVRGDSMERTLSDGDEILVDGDRRMPGPRDGLFVLRLDGALMVKRLRMAGAQVEVISDNPRYETRLCEADAVAVVGRVVWLGRSLL
jgi:repressor LexA